MTIYPELAEKADMLREAWTQPEDVDLESADDLVRELRGIDLGDLDEMPEIRGILDYAAYCDQWDPEKVQHWPDSVYEALDGVKHYSYESEGDSWRVFSYTLAGNRDWVGDVETEALAQTLVAAITGEGVTSIGERSEQANQLFQVHVMRVAYSKPQIIQVSCPTRIEAYTRACEVAGDLSFADDTAEYTVEFVAAEGEARMVGADRLALDLT